MALPRYRIADWLPVCLSVCLLTLWVYLMPGQTTQEKIGLTICLPYFAQGTMGIKNKLFKKKCGSNFAGFSV